jgi:hypothetical protein
MSEREIRIAEMWEITLHVLYIVPTEQLQHYIT